MPDLDVSNSSIPTDEVFFDTAEAAPGYRLSRMNAETIRRVMDLIEPIYDPVYGGGSSLPWLTRSELVIGIESENGAYAYPVRVLNIHEIVNDVIDGQPVLVTYCPLCGSGVVYRRELGGEPLLFGNSSGLYQSELVGDGVVVDEVGVASVVIFSLDL